MMVPLQKMHRGVQKSTKDQVRVKTSSSSTIHTSHSTHTKQSRNHQPLGIPRTYARVLAENTAATILANKYGASSTGMSMAVSLT